MAKRVSCLLYEALSRCPCVIHVAPLFCCRTVPSRCRSWPARCPQAVHTGRPSDQHLSHHSTEHARFLLQSARRCRSLQRWAEMWLLYVTLAKTCYLQNSHSAFTCSVWFVERQCYLIGFVIAMQCIFVRSEVKFQVLLKAYKRIELCSLFSSVPAGSARIGPQIRLRTLPVTSFPIRLPSYRDLGFPCRWRPSEFSRYESLLRW